MKNLRFTGRRLDASEFLIPMVHFCPPNQLDRSCEKLRSQGGEKYPTYNKKKKG
jgi:hypothetical protein